MNCILLERTHSQTTIKEYLSRVPYFNLVASCSSVFDAYEVLRSTKIDIIFAETELTRVSGIDFIKSLDHKPLCVFISDDPQLAVEAFNLNALDFLLKPVSFNRFFKTAHKAYDAFTLQNKNGKAIAPLDIEGGLNNKILVKTEYKTVAINLNDVLYFEGLKDYIKIYIRDKDKPIITLSSLKKLQQSLPSHKFSRIHKSFIVGLDHINAINKSQVIICDKHIPIGESYRHIFIEKMEEFRI